MGRSELLVEGNDDQTFFKAHLNLIGLITVNVRAPKSLDASTGDGWPNLVKNLPILLKQIIAGDVEKFGIVLDADYPPANNGGFDKRFQLISNELTKVGYIIPSKPRHKFGEIFVHPNGLPSVGLWIMPDHQSNGMLEGFVESMVSDAAQISLLNHAEKSINTLPVTLFDKTLHLTKAKVFTWRAWQKRPGIPLNLALQDGILDRSKSVNFENWLKQVFK
jgi:hypothetical protein